MRMMLSNVGHRRVLHMVRTPSDRDASFAALVGVLKRGAKDAAEIARCAALVEQGLLQSVPAEMDLEAIYIRYGRNPLENVSRVVFEYTTLCNLSCRHCRNGSLSPVTTKDLRALSRVVDAVVPLGIRRFDFIGGEVLMYGMKWPQLATHIRSSAGTVVNILTSGWFFGERNFWAAGHRHADDQAFLASLVEAGVTHVTFSLDGPAEIHDECRQTPGLYQRIMTGFAAVRAAGLIPQVSLVFFPGLTQQQQTAWLTQLAASLHPALSPASGRTAIESDEMNYMSHFIDVGNAAGLSQGDILPESVPDSALRCKNFFRPAPALRFKASGELSLCPLIDAGDGYGNVQHTDPIDLLNGMQDTFAFRLHAENRLPAYRRLVDRALFSGPIAHVCSMRVIVTMLARAIHDAGYDDRTAPPAVLAALNLRVAQRVGHLPAADPSPLGRKPP